MKQNLAAIVMMALLVTGCLHDSWHDSGEEGVRPRGLEQEGREVAIFAQLNMMAPSDSARLKIALVNAGLKVVRLPVWWGESGLSVTEVYDPPVAEKDDMGRDSRIGFTARVVEAHKVLGSYDLNPGQCAVFECDISLLHPRADVSQLQIKVIVPWYREDGSEGSTLQDFVFLPGESGVLKLRSRGIRLANPSAEKDQ